jgi:Putative stress-induced transcription regulator
MEKSDLAMSSATALSLANARLGSAGDLGAWLEAEGAIEPDERAEVALRLAEFVTLRASIRELLEASIGGGPFPAGALERVNEASARVPRVVRLAPDGPADAPLSAGPTPLLLARIAWSAIELLGDPDRSRARRCGRVRELLRVDAFGPRVVLERLREPHPGGPAQRPPTGCRVTSRRDHVSGPRRA